MIGMQLFLLLLINADLNEPYINEKWLTSDNKIATENIENVITRSNSVIELYHLDSLFLEYSLYNKSELVQEKILKKISGDYNYINTELSRKYEERGYNSIKNNRIDKGLRELNFAFKIDRSNQSVPLIMLKHNILNWKKSYQNIKRYFTTIRFPDNLIKLSINTLYLLIILTSVIIFSMILIGLFTSLSFIGYWIQQTFNISILWVPAILFSFFVWAPLPVFIVILAGISLVKIPRKAILTIGILMILLPVLLGLMINMIGKFKPDGPAYRILKARYDPYNYKILNPQEPYSYAVAGIENARSKNYERAKKLFKKGLEIKSDRIFTSNLASLHYVEGKIDSSITIFEKILDRDPDHPIANITMANIYLDELEFDKASMYLDKATKKGGEFNTREAPIYLYPPDLWVIRKSISVGEILNIIKNNKLYILLILGLFFIILSTMKNTASEKRCPLCGRFKLFKKKSKEPCLKCKSELAVTKSKAIRESLKRKITRRKNKMKNIKNYIMNLIIPGSAHVFRSHISRGILFFIVLSILIGLYLGMIYPSEYSQFPYKTYIGESILMYLFIGFYIVVLFSTWRLSKHGNAG